MKPPVLVFAWGNPSRGDDALGPLFAEQLAALVDPAEVEILCDFQLQVEHALDLVGRERVLFVDATMAGELPSQLIAISAETHRQLTSHAMSPQSLLQVHAAVSGEPPPSWLLSIRGERFELGAELSDSAQANLVAALAAARAWVADARQCATTE